ncbi:hypothetical protein [Photorhabdus sp. RM323S]
MWFLTDFRHHCAQYGMQSSLLTGGTTRIDIEMIASTSKNVHQGQSA